MSDYTEEAEEIAASWVAAGVLASLAEKSVSAELVQALNRAEQNALLEAADAWERQKKMPKFPAEWMRERARRKKG